MQGLVAHVWHNMLGALQVIWLLACWSAPQVPSALNKSFDELSCLKID